MNANILPIVIALCVVLAAWAITQAAVAALSGEKRRIKSRLKDDRGGQISADALGAFGGGTAAAGVTLYSDAGMAAGLSGVLARQAILAPMYRRLIQAYPDMPFARFVGICLGLGLFGFLIPAALDYPALGVLAGMLGFYLPVLLVNAKRAQRQKQIGAQLPEALEFLSRILRAGHSLSTGLQMMAEELPRPLCEEFRRCYNQHSLGQSLDDALKDAARRVDSTDFAFFVTSVLIQRQTGGDLSEVLGNISNMIRQRIRLQQHVKAKTAEGRLTGYILVAFPAIMFAISYALNPAHMGKLIHDRMGLGLLATAVMLQLLGLWAIRRITVLKV